MSSANWCSAAEVTDVLICGKCGVRSTPQTIGRWFIDDDPAWVRCDAHHPYGAGPAPASDWTTCTVDGGVVYAFHVPCRRAFIVPQEHACSSPPSGETGEPAPAGIVWNDEDTGPLTEAERAHIQMLATECAGDEWAPSLADCLFRRYEATVAALESRLLAAEREREALTTEYSKLVRVHNGVLAYREALEGLPSGTIPRWDDPAALRTPTETPHAP